jgi:membrane protease YdiL (CAAX protease family)
MKPDVFSVRPASFFALTYLLSWLIWIPLDLSHFGFGPFRAFEQGSSLLRLVGVLMPAVSAIILAARAGGRAGVSTVLERLSIWRVGWNWWAAAVMVQPVLLVLSALIYNALGGRPQVIAAGALPIATLVVNVLFLLLATLGEEIGWRGLALPSLERRGGSLRASIILGVLWATWHVPFWLLQDTFDQFGIGYLVLSGLLILPGTFYITWFYDHSRGSLFLPVAFHIAFNIVNVVWLPVTTTVGALAIFIVTQWIVAALILPRIAAQRLPANWPLTA